MTADRDRVTAILTLTDEARARGTWADVDWDPEWAYRRLLEALDTIDKARELHQLVLGHHQPSNFTGRCLECGGRQWPCPTWQALNGGNE